MINELWVTVAQVIALQACTLALFASIRTRPKDNPRFRIDKVVFHDGSVVYYNLRRWWLNQWQVFEIEKGVRGYRSEVEAKRALESYLANLGIEMSETKVVKEYG